MRPSARGLLLASLLSPAGLLGLLAPLATGCATYQDELSRGERAFEASEDERALAIFRNLESDTSRLGDSDRAHYAYLRGMTDYRIGYKAEARHWLAVAAALEQATPGSLPADWAKRMGEALKELNEEVYTAGIESLSNSAVAEGEGDRRRHASCRPGQEPVDAPEERPVAPAASSPAPVRRPRSALAKGVELVLRRQALFLQLGRAEAVLRGHVTPAPIQLVDGEVESIVTKLELADVDSASSGGYLRISRPRRGHEAAPSSHFRR